MKGSMLPLWLGLLVTFAVGYGFYKGWQSQREAPATTAAVAPLGPPATEFTLTDSRGEPLRSRDLRGDVWVATIFFTACPSVCVALNRQIEELQRDPKFAEVKFVSISCDPKRDTPVVLQRYADRFGADPKRWFFCTGDPAYVEKISHDVLKIALRGVEHSERAVVFDRAGRVRGQFVITASNMPSDLDKFEAMLTTCLAEPAPAPEVNSAQHKPEIPASANSVPVPQSAEAAAP